MLKFCYPGYRYCGPGCKGPGKPINRVDAACRQHDACYERNQSRRMRARCDEEFMNHLKSVMTSNTREGRHARNMYRAMRLIRLFQRL